MSTEKPAPHSPKLQEYLQAWGASIGRVLQEVAGAPHTWQELSPEATQALLASLKENSIGIQFEATQHLSGNQGFVLVEKRCRTAGAVITGGAGGRQLGDER